VQTWLVKRRRESATVGDVNLLVEVKRLKKENAQLQEEADILKKAAHQEIPELALTATAT